LLPGCCLLLTGCCASSGRVFKKPSETKFRRNGMCRCLAPSKVKPCTVGDGWYAVVSRGDSCQHNGLCAFCLSYSNSLVVG
jgi:hypothetical protein